MTESVHAAVMLAPGRIETREFPWPELQLGAVLIKMEMSGICGTDKHTYAGYTTQYAGTEHERTIPFPIIPGHENVGRIAQIGTRSGDLVDFGGHPLQEGDRVVIGANLSCGQCYYCRHGFEYYYCANLEDYGNSLSAANPPHLFGGWADYLYALPGSYLFKVPDDLPSEIAVLTELMAVTTGLDKAKQFSAVDSEGFRFGDTVVIQGAGPVGICHVIKARMLGAGDIIAIDRSAFRLDLALEMGADHILSLSGTDGQQRREAIQGWTGGRGADLVVECAGVPEAVPEGLDLLRPGGFYIECGNFTDMGPVLINPHLICSKNARIIGVNGEAITAYAPSLQALSRYRKHYPVHKIVTHRYSVERAKEAIELAMTDDSMKVVIASSEHLEA
jgi:threonine dehydrogenase-like Zn-dependent dehydrogenase